MQKNTSPNTIHASDSDAGKNDVVPKSGLPRLIAIALLLLLATTAFIRSMHGRHQSESLPWASGISMDLPNNLSGEPIYSDGK